MLAIREKKLENLAIFAPGGDNFYSSKKCPE